jgi:hypothetical protein
MMEGNQVEPLMEKNFHTLRYILVKFKENYEGKCRI